MVTFNTRDLGSNPIMTNFFQNICFLSTVLKKTDVQKMRPLMARFLNIEMYEAKNDGEILKVV